MSREGFTVMLMKLKIYGPSLARAPSKALGGTLEIFTFVPNFVFVILYSFS
jgi:hypothetical protein